MSFKAGKLEIKEDSHQLIENPSLADDLLLDKKELQILLSLIKTSSFEGKDIELIFNLTWKLQQAFLSLDKD
jgi:hypothetical protein